MSSMIDPRLGEYTLTELSQIMGVDEVEAAAILDEHGLRVPIGEESLTLTEEIYLDLMEEAPLTPEGVEG
jgi:hypothetical protein